MTVDRPQLLILLLAACARPGVAPRVVSAEPPPSAARPRVVSVAVGGWQSCVVFDNGKGRCWGKGLFGNLGRPGLRDIGDDETPSDGDFDAGGKVSAISVGKMQMCVLLDRRQASHPGSLRHRLRELQLRRHHDQPVDHSLSLGRERRKAVFRSGATGRALSARAELLSAHLHEHARFVSECMHRTAIPEWCRISDQARLVHPLLEMATSACRRASHLESMQCVPLV